MQYPSVRCRVISFNFVAMLLFFFYRNRILQDIDRFIHPEQVINRVVYSLDESVSADGSGFAMDQSQLVNDDERRFVRCSVLHSRHYLIK